MVAVEVQVVLFELASVTVKVTVLPLPTFAHPKVVGLAARLNVQLSSDPSSTSVAAIVALPAASRSTVMFLQLAVGGVLSNTVTVAVQVWLFE
jgi:hypothetical protein